MDFQDALAFHRQGRTDSAAQAYEHLLRTDPAHYDALIHFGALRLSQGRAQMAETLLRRAVALAPDAAEALGNLAAALQAQGRHAEAAELYERTLRNKPDLLDARFGLAACQQACGKDEAAIADYEAILAANPAHPEARYGLATLLARVGRGEAAAAHYRAALAADPDFAEASFGLGKLLAQRNSLEDAITCYRQALDVDPDYIEARAALGIALSRLDQDDEAMVEFHTVLAAEADYPDAHIGIAVLLERKLQHEDAMTHYRAVLAVNPEQIDAMAGMANALKNTGRHWEALTIARRVLAQRPNFAPAISLLGVILAELGEMQEAQCLIRRAATLAHNRPEILYHAALLSKVQPDDGTVKALDAALPLVDSFTPREKCLLFFALAKAYDDLGEHEHGFTHLLRGNAIKRSRTPYHEAATLAGMARSGTTLVEQILASHAAVFGAGERTELANCVRHLTAERIGASGFPEAVWTLPGESLRRMGADYVAALRSLAPAAIRIIDKMPGNFLYLGLIRLILPNARIIHVRRDPVDTCLSCFSKLFTGIQPFAYELGELGRYYRSYERLMAHWRTVLPADLLLEVEYEALVNDFEPQVRGIVAHCGLPWDPGCLQFYKTRRAVHTASMVQVRQPIYRSAIGRWRPDAALLQPLLDALDGAPIAD